MTKYLRGAKTTLQEAKALAQYECNLGIFNHLSIFLKSTFIIQSHFFLLCFLVDFANYTLNLLQMIMKVSISYSRYSKGASSSPSKYPNFTSLILVFSFDALLNVENIALLLFFLLTSSSFSYLMSPLFIFLIPCIFCSKIQLIYIVIIKQLKIVENCTS